MHHSSPIIDENVDNILFIKPSSVAGHPGMLRKDLATQTKGKGHVDKGNIIYTLKAVITM
jgi:hypothetical protein